MQETSPRDYFTLNFRFLWTFLRSPKQWCVAAVIGVWAYSAVTIFQSSYIQFSPDSFLYKALSQQPLTLTSLLRGDRSPTLPVLLKLFKSEEAFVWFQLCFFYLSWMTLFLLLRHVVRIYPVYLALIAMLAALSLAQVYFSWHKLILTESVSLSGAVLLLALLCRIMIADNFTHAAFGYTLVAWVMWQFARDSNTYFSLLIVIGFLFVATIGRLAERRSPKWKKAQALAVVMGLFASLQLWSINHSDRWQFPLIDVIGLRVLPNQEMHREFVEMGMPVNAKTMCFLGKNAVDCNKDWSGFGDWLSSGKARVDYQNWLIKHFVNAVTEVLVQWEKIWTSETILYGRSVESPVSKLATKVALPKGDHFLNFIAASAVAAALALCVALRHRFRHWLSILLIFYAANIPIAFIAYHGDALDVDRHTLNVQLNTYLTGWILIFWAISFLIEAFLCGLRAGYRKLRAVRR